MNIFKYPLEITDFQTVKMPFSAEILSVKEQNGTLCLWALVDPDIGFEMDYKIHIIGTGAPIDSAVVKSFYGGLYFIDTVVMSYGLVWHVFQEK